jgi:hypothetical protein
VVVPAPGASVTEAALRAFLVGRVADFKIPARIFVGARIPRTNTGKVQRYDLSKRFSELSAITYEAPRPGYETVVAESFAHVLGHERFGRNDHFLESGGDSLSAFRAILLINKRVGLDLPSSVILRHPTVSDLALAAQAAHAAAGVDYPRIEAEVGALSDASVVRLLAVEDGPGSAKR